MRNASALILIASLIGLVSPAWARHFSADLVDAGGGARGRLYVEGSKVRIESHDIPGAYFLIDQEIPTAFLVRPSQQTVMDARQSSFLTTIFLPVDPSDPCAAWHRMANLAMWNRQNQKWQCRYAGDDVVNGVRTRKFRIEAASEPAYFGWIDPTLRFPVRFQSADGAVISLTHIRAEIPPAALFAIPAHFHRFDPQRLIDRIKQSDVWVAPPP